MTTIGIILALLFLDWPLQGIVIGILALFEIVEISIFLRWRRRRALTGSEGMVGAEGVALTDCAPDGQVKVKGGIWKAHSRDGVRAGDPIRVTAVDGLSLHVERDEERAVARSKIPITRR